MASPALDAPFWSGEDGPEVYCPSRWGVWSPNDQEWTFMVQQIWEEESMALRCSSHSDAPRIPKIIHQIWLGGNQIPPECIPWMESWKRYHPDWEYKLWQDGDLENLPLLPRCRALIASASNPAEKADILRLEVDGHQRSLPGMREGCRRRLCVCRLCVCYLSAVAAVWWAVCGCGF
mmetsp:Transcript_11949/g.34641  ORF Transcript_11949/g.34641 Transcript_11949/m.34641 type:complete len:177 (+) Transcript_11949:86-616(+)